MAKTNRVCLTCNTKYSYCPNCNKKDPSWMAEFHSESCKNIFDICTRFNMNLLTKAEAKDALQSCDLSNKDNFKDYVQNDLANIFKPDEDKITVNVEAEITKDEVVVEVKPVTRGKSKSKSHEVVHKTEE